MLIELVQNGALQLVIRVGLGALMTAAGLQKARWRERWGEDLLRLGIAARSLLGRVLGALPWMELLLGLMLLMGLYVRAAGGMTAALLLALAAGLARAARSLRRVRLRCAPGLRCGADAWTVTRNLLLAAIAGLVAIGGGDSLSLDHWLRRTPGRPIVGWDLPAALGLIVCLAAMAMLLSPLAAVAARSRRLAQGRS